ncbi:MAG: cytidine deaminase [Clostridia bacterium]|nr:cytidine deaminase [Clostridia bacterium]
MDAKKLLEQAAAAAKNAYAPYSGFAVGAALLAESGKVFTGCNVENSSFSPSVCAERTAVVKAVSEGERHFKAIAVVGRQNPCFPCGVCRQVLAEFCDKDFCIYVYDGGEPKLFTLGELLPHAFFIAKTGN